MPTPLLALHGFLGLPSDWDPWREKGWKTPSLSTVEWEGEIAMGYSLGGRRLLHALSHHLFQPRAAIFISTHTGLKNEEERSRRREQDLWWADRFLNDPWENVVKAWNQQVVFGEDSIIAPRQEEQFNRHELARQLTEWSLGNQEDFSRVLSTLSIPVFWIVGSLDKRYADQAKELTLLHPRSKIWIAEGASHRIPWTKQEEFRQQIKGWMHDVDNSRAL